MGRLLGEAATLYEERGNSCHDAAAALQRRDRHWRRRKRRDRLDTPGERYRHSLGVGCRLDESFFRIRFDRLTPREKEYFRAMAELGTGPHRSADIAEMLDMHVRSAAPLRNGLIRKGMIWSPAHGDTDFTVPLFDQFMRRILPSRPLTNGRPM